MAIANFKMKIFDDPKALLDFALADSACDNIVAIICDNSGKYILYYTGT